MKRIILIMALLTASLTAFAQGVTVKGRVVDEATNEPLDGVSIIDPASRNGVITMPDGSFEIKVKNLDSVLSFYYLGYEDKEVKVASAKMIVKMKSTATSLEEVVVVGYGSQRKESVTGAISTTSAEELKKIGATNVSTALAGSVAGMTFTVDSGRPGEDDATIYIRGVSTLNAANSTPLVLVDGVEREWSQISPEDIEHLSVLKDASATAVYGVRGANGVILITTKRGEKSAPKVRLNYKTSLQTPTRLPNFLGSYDHAVLRNEALANDGAPAAFSEEAIEHYKSGDSPYLYPDNNYVNDFLKKVTPMQIANFSVRGGSDKVKYYVALSGQMQDGIYKQFDGKYPSNSNYKNVNLRANLDINLTKTTVLSFDMNARLTQRQNNSQGLSDNTIFSLMYQTPPMSYPYLNPDGSYGANADTSQSNLLAMLSDWGYSRLADNVLESNFKLKQDLSFITEGLSARGQVSFNNYYETGTKVSYRPPTYNYSIDASGNEVYNQIIEEVVPSISSLDGKGLRRRLNMEYAIDYDRVFGDHAVTGMLVYNQSTYNANAKLPQSYLGYAARATYAYKRTYLLEVNMAYNGSDQFEKSQRYGFFPSVSGGWVVTSLPFFKENLSWITFMKLRATYGEVGNDQIGSDRFLYLQTYDKSSNAYYFGKDDAFGGQSGLTEGDLGNEHVTWEVAKKFNVGVDIKLFKKLSVNFDWFSQNRENIFIARNTTPLVLGVGTAKENLGKVSSKGFEIEGMWNDKIGSDFSYFLKGMFTYSENKVVYKDEVEPKYEYLRQTGKSVGQFFGYTVLRYYTPDDFTIDEEGLYQLKEGYAVPQYSVQPGDFMYEDLNKDGVIDIYDKGPIGKTSIPAFVYNFSFGFNFKQLDFSMMWQGAGGHNKLMTKSLYEPVRENNRFQEIHLYRWTQERWENGEDIQYPRLSSATNNHNQTTNTYYLKKGDYLRLKSVELGYTFNKKQLHAVGLSSLRIYASGNNLLTFSAIKNFDPEMSESTGFFYPQMKNFSLGFDINF